jgi:hypothetical protein
MTYSHYKDPERRREYERQWRLANRERFLAKMREWRERNPDKVKQHNQQWYAENPERKRENWERWRRENPEKAKALAGRYRDGHRDVVRKIQQRWEQENPQSGKARRKKYEQANPDKIRAKSLNRSALERGAEGVFTAKDWATLIAHSPHCHWCKKPFTKTRRATHDHVVPLAKGGANSLENSCCACRPCNSRKHARLINPITGQGLLL